MGAGLTFWGDPGPNENVSPFSDGAIRAANSLYSRRVYPPNLKDTRDRDTKHSLFGEGIRRAQLEQCHSRVRRREEYVCRATPDCSPEPGPREWGRCDQRSQHADPLSVGEGFVLRELWPTLVTSLAAIFVRHLLARRSTARHSFPRRARQKNDCPWKPLSTRFLVPPRRNHISPSRNR